jgi:hypothetical protein
MTDTATTATTAATNAQNAVSLVVLLFVAVIAIIMAVGAIVTFWKLFTKAGKPGWAIFVPVYNFMIMGKVAGYAPWVGITTGVLSLLTSFVPFLGLVVVGLEIYLLIGMKEKYDAGWGFWILAIVLPIITLFTVKNVNYKGGDTPAPSVAGPQAGGTPPDAPAQPMQTPAPQAPTTEPPAPQPPVSAPPVSEPPDSEPAASEPPASQPPAV